MYITILLLVSQHVFGGGLFYDGPSARDFERNNANMAREIHIVQQQFSIDQRQFLETMNINMERQRQEITSDMNRYVAEFGRSAGNMANAGRYIADTIDASTRLFVESNNANVLRISETSERCINRLTDTVRFILDNIDVQRREIAIDSSNGFRNIFHTILNWIFIAVAVYHGSAYIGLKLHGSSSFGIFVGFGLLYILKDWIMKQVVENRLEIAYYKQIKKNNIRHLAIKMFNDNSGSCQKDPTVFEKGILGMNQFVGSWKGGIQRKEFYIVRENENLVRNENGQAVWKIQERKTEAGRITHFELRNRLQGVKDIGSVAWVIEFGAKDLVWETAESEIDDMRDFMPWVKVNSSSSIES